MIILKIKHICLCHGLFMSFRNLCFDDFCIHNIKFVEGAMDALEKG
jgi:hypothetical protein